MIALEQIEAELIHVSEGEALALNLVAVAVKLNDLGEAHHSGLLIGVEGEYFLFHYTGATVELEDRPSQEAWYLCKELEIINGSEFSLDFLAHCQNILDEEAPYYGLWYDGSYYDEQGKHFTETNAANFTTCVGFCIKVISGFIHHKENYFELSDWDMSSTVTFHDRFPGYFPKFLEVFSKTNPNITEEEFKMYYKRISPSEYTASAFISNLPIKRAAIEEILDLVEAALKKRRTDHLIQ